MGGRLVVGVDGSDSARNALDFAVEEARRRDADLEAVMAYRWLAYYPGMEYGAIPALPQEDVEAEALQALLEAIADAPKDIRLVPKAIDGPAARVLIEASEGADLLIVGSRGHGGFTGLLLGSTSHQVVSHATCPVVIVPSG